MLRRPLSSRWPDRQVTDSAGGVVDVKVKFNMTTEEWLPAEVGKSVEAAVAALKLPQGAKLNFIFALLSRDDRTQSRLRAQAQR
jgi:hypothetical protein